jgi:hypothetical protein
VRQRNANRDDKVQRHASPYQHYVFKEPSKARAKMVSRSLGQDSPHTAEYRLAGMQLLNLTQRFRWFIDGPQDAPDDPKPVQ